jgi:hypothetical protein
MEMSCLKKIRIKLTQRKIYFHLFNFKTFPHYKPSHREEKERFVNEITPFKIRDD